jgi:Cohesin domain
LPEEAPLKPRTRKLGIIVAGAAVVALAWFAPPGSDDVALPAKGGAAKASSTQSRDASRLAALPERAAIGKQRGEIFGSTAWTPPPAKVPPVEDLPPVEVIAPPNPYKVAGTLVQEGAKRVYLVKGDRVYEAKQGDELDEGYRVESIASDHVVLLYVPLGKKEQLPIAATLGVDVVQSEPAPAAVTSSATPATPAPAPSAAASAGASASASDPSAPAQLRWEGPERVRAGASFTVALRVSSDQPLRATPMQLRYEPELLEALGVRAGKFFGQGNFSYRVNPDGSIFIGATGQGAAPGADAELVVVTFKPIKAGATAEVKLSSVALQGTAGRALAHNQVSAFRTAIQ